MGMQVPSLPQGAPAPLGAELELGSNVIFACPAGLAQAASQSMEDGAAREDPLAGMLILPMSQAAGLWGLQPSMLEQLQGSVLLPGQQPPPSSPAINSGPGPTIELLSELEPPAPTRASARETAARRSLSPPRRYAGDDFGTRLAEARQEWRHPAEFGEGTWQSGRAPVSPPRSRSGSPRGQRYARPERQHDSSLEELGDLLAEWRHAPSGSQARARSHSCRRSSREQGSARLRARSSFPAAAGAFAAPPHEPQRPTLRPEQLQKLQGLLREQAWNPQAAAHAVRGEPAVPEAAVAPRAVVAPRVAEAPRAAAGPSAVAAPRAARVPAEPSVPRVLVQDFMCQTESEAAESLDLCVICMTQPRTHASLPCGHRCWCCSCAQRQQNRSAASGALKCPLCREESTLGLFEITDAVEHPRRPASPAAAAQSQERRGGRRKKKQRQPLRTGALAQMLQQALITNSAKKVERPCSFAGQEAACQTEGDGTVLCTMCSRQPACVAAVPCGHRCICELCEGALQEEEMGAPLVCPLCCADSLGFYRIYN